MHARPDRHDGSISFLPGIRKVAPTSPSHAPHTHTHTHKRVESVLRSQAGSHGSGTSDGQDRLSSPFSNGGSVSPKLTFPAGLVRTAAASTDSGRPRVVSQRVKAVAASFHPRARTNEIDETVTGSCTKKELANRDHAKKKNTWIICEHEQYMDNMYMNNAWIIWSCVVPFDHCFAFCIGYRH